MKVLVIDEDIEVLEVVQRALAKDNHVVVLGDGLTSGRRALAQQPDLVVLGLGIGGDPALAFCRRLRAERWPIPVLGLAGESRVALRVRALDAGADDCLSMPFALVELRARVRALARRASRTSLAPTVVRIGPNEVELDFAKRIATRATVGVPLTARQWAILTALAAHGGAVVRRDDLLETVWGESTETNANCLEVLVGRLRRKLGLDVIRTLRGEGYAFWSQR